MRCRSVAILLLAAGCGSVKDRSECVASADCPAGSYCARTKDGNVCWPDSVPPAVSSVTVTCDRAPCLRNGVLHVTAEVTDDSELSGAEVSLSLGGAPVPMASSTGTTFEASVELARYPFDAFSADVLATVTARDGARNEASGAAGVNVTRMKFTKPLDSGVVGLTPPAVTQNGTIVTAGTNGKLYFAPWDGSNVTSIAVGTGQITAAPAVGERAIWVGSEDFNLYAVKLDGTGLVANVGVATEGAVKGSVAVLPPPAKEWGFATSGSGRVAAASTTQFEYARSVATDAFTVGPVLKTDGKVCAATATATLRCYSFDGSAFSEDFSVPVGVNVSAPLAVDGGGNIWTGSQDAKLNVTSASGATKTVATLPGSIVDSPVVLDGGDVVAGDQSGHLQRYAPSGTQVWQIELEPGVAVLSPMVLSGTQQALVVPTKGGKLHALRADGSSVWSFALAGAPELRAGSIYTPFGQPQDAVTSIAYFTGSNGKLYAVVVDGRLDEAAPWPKAFHDPRNTSRAGAQP